MPPTKPRSPRGKKAELQAWLDVERPTEIGEPQWDALRTALAPISRGYLRKLLRESGIALAPLVEGVRQDDFETLQRSLTALLAEYEIATPERRSEIRKLVIEAKDHARWAAKSPEHRAAKQEMILWMLTWLENPPLFPNWVALRKQAREPDGH